MNVNDPLLLEGLALRQLFEKDTLYVTAESREVSAEEPGNLTESSSQTESENSAIEETPKKTEEEASAQPELIYQGDAEADLALIFFHEGSQALPVKGLEVVRGLIENEKAMNRSLNAVCSLNWNAQTNIKWNDVLDQVMAKQLIFWGEFPEGLDLEPEKYQVQDLQGRSYLLSDSPAILANNPGLKGKLWMAIKNNWL